MITNQKNLILGVIFIILLVILTFMMFNNFLNKNTVNLQVEGNPINNFYYSLVVSGDGQATYKEGTLFENGKISKKETKKTEKMLEMSGVDSLLDKIQKADFFDKDFGGPCPADTPSVKLSVRTAEKHRTVQGCMNEELTNIVNIINNHFGMQKLP